MLNRLERQLATEYKKKHCVLTASGTVALWLAFSQLPLGKKVLLPAMVCPNLLYAASLAEREVVYADIRDIDATICPDSVESKLSRHSEIGIVVAVHLFGNNANIRVLKDVVDKHGAILVEDAAQSMGGLDDENVLLGTKGDVSILSFGHTKIIQAGGGGAFLTDNDDWTKDARSLLSTLDHVSKSRLDELSEEYRRLFYPIWIAGQREQSFYSLFESFPMLFKDMFLHQAGSDQVAKITNALEGLAEKVTHRREVAEIYRHELSPVDGIKFFRSAKGIVPWRFSFRIDPSIRGQFLKYIRDKGFDVSSWYPCVAKWMCDEAESGHFPVAERIEREIINLWVDESYGQNRAMELSCAVNEFMGSLHNQLKKGEVR